MGLFKVRVINMFVFCGQSNYTWPLSLPVRISGCFILNRPFWSHHSSWTAPSLRASDLMPASWQTRSRDSDRRSEVHYTQMLKLEESSGLLRPTESPWVYSRILTVPLVFHCFPLVVFVSFQHCFQTLSAYDPHNAVVPFQDEQTKRIQDDFKEASENRRSISAGLPQIFIASV